MIEVLSSTIFSMFYVYVLQSDLNSTLYVGSTNDLKARFKNHNEGEVFSTKRYRPWKLIYYEAYIDEQLARMREQKLKHHGNAIRHLKNRILKKIKNSAGFTLVEILVVISLMSVLMLTSVITFSSFSRNQSFQTSTADVVALLNVARSKSLNQVRPEECINSPQGYQVAFSISGSSYSLVVVCDSTTHQLEEKKLPPQITFAGNSDTVVFFEGSTGVVNDPADVIMTGFDKTKTIHVNNIGNISVE